MQTYRHIQTRVWNKTHTYTYTQTSLSHTHIYIYENTRTHTPAQAQREDEHAYLSIAEAALSLHPSDDDQAPQVDLQVLVDILADGLAGAPRPSLLLRPDSATAKTTQHVRTSPAGGST